MRWLSMAGMAAICLAAAGCGDPAEQRARVDARLEREYAIGAESIFDLFRSNTDPRTTIGVNRYLWAASLDILSFLPIEAADPFSGLISTDWGRVAGSPTPYRVTVYVTDAALDARALKVAAFRMAGGNSVPVAAAENRQIEDAILTRARQMRIAEAGRS